jgi:16S rRNA (guanine966-N2)-methyltransferase
MTKRRSTTKHGQIRIIGGKCKGRKIFFPDIPDLRPTPNRIRETLFNWLAPTIQDATCLDLFAGSGALSFEALSRGAGYCLLLDSSKTVMSYLQENQQKLGFNNMEILWASFPYPPHLIKTTFDIIFIDPPFRLNLLKDIFDWLVSSKCLASGSLIYIESERQMQQIYLPENWRLLKDKWAGNVRYQLCEVL